MQRVLNTKWSKGEKAIDSLGTKRETLKLSGLNFIAFDIGTFNH